jgi:hypothetical protein
MILPRQHALAHRAVLDPSAITWMTPAHGRGAVIPTADDRGGRFSRDPADASSWSCSLSVPALHPDQAPVRPHLTAA